MPVQALIILAQLVGIYFLILGVLALASIFVDASAWGWKLLGGVVGVLAGLLDQDAYWMYDASIVWTSSDDRLTFGVHGKNLGDERYRVGGYTFPGALTGNSIIGFYGPPRTVTATLGLKF